MRVMGGGGDYQVSILTGVVLLGACVNSVAGRVQGQDRSRGSLGVAGNFGLHVFCSQVWLQFHGCTRRCLALLGPQSVNAPGAHSL
jgi:hypothetical protein